MAFSPTMDIFVFDFAASCLIVEFYCELAFSLFLLC